MNIAGRPECHGVLRHIPAQQPRQRDQLVLHTHELFARIANYQTIRPPTGHKGHTNHTGQGRADGAGWFTAAPVCVCTHFQCLSCLSCLCSGLVLSALYMASATASMDQGLTLIAPDKLGEQPTNSATHSRKASHTTEEEATKSLTQSAMLTLARTTHASQPGTPNVTGWQRL